MTYDDLVLTAARAVANAESLQSIIKLPRVKLLYQRLSIELRQSFSLMVQQVHVSQLLAFIDKHSNYEDMPVRTLRKLAARLDVPYYTKMDKGELIKAVRNVESAVAHKG